MCSPQDFELSDLLFSGFRSDAPCQIRICCQIGARAPLEEFVGVLPLVVFLAYSIDSPESSPLDEIT